MVVYLPAGLIFEIPFQFRTDFKFCSSATRRGLDVTNAELQHENACFSLHQKIIPLLLPPLSANLFRVLSCLFLMTALEAHVRW